MNQPVKIQLLTITLLMAIFRVAVFAQGTAFTYQGKLNDSGVPANGSYDLELAVFDGDQPTTNLIAGPVMSIGTVASNGMFTVTLDFGGVFDGSSRWLEIGVRTNGGTGFSVLSPRQQLAPVPYAIHAATAATASNVGAGTAVTSVNGLHDDLILTAGTNITITPVGNTLTVAGTAGLGDIWNLNAGNAYFTAGKVGVGTIAPSHMLGISGGPIWTTAGWKGAIDLDNASALGWHSDADGQSFGIGQTGGGLYIFHTASSPATVTAAANYDLEISDDGQVSILHNLIVGGDVTPLKSSGGNLGNFFAPWDNIYATGSVMAAAFVTPSDRRLKADITPLEYGTHELMELRPVSYEWKDKRDTRTHVGFIAQELKEIIPEAVYGSAGEGSLMGVNYTDLIPVVVKAVQEQEGTIRSNTTTLEKLQADNEELKAQNAALEERIRLIEAKLGARP